MRSLFFKALLLIIVIYGIPHTVFAESLSVTPAAGTFEEGKSFTVQVTATTPDQAINAVSGTLSFPQDKIKVTSISKTNSILTLWVQEPTFSNAQGVINFEGVVPNPGFTGYQGTILYITFRVVGQGMGILKFNAGSMLANNGEGTNIAKDLNGASYTLVAAPEKPIEKPVEKTPVPKPEKSIEVLPSPVVTSTPEVLPEIPVVVPVVEPCHINYIPIILVTCGLSIFFVLFLLYLSNGFAGFKRKIIKDTANAERDIHREFDELKDLVRKELLVFEETRTKKDFAKERVEVLEKIARHITHIEHNVQDHVEDIKNRLK